MSETTKSTRKTRKRVSAIPAAAPVIPERQILQKAVVARGFLLIRRDVLKGSESRARLLYGLMTGIGFIGGGAILRDSGSAHGSATAASIWNTGAIGASVAWERYEIALVLSAVNFATLRWVPSRGPFTRSRTSRTWRKRSLNALSPVGVRAAGLRAEC